MTRRSLSLLPLPLALLLFGCGAPESAGPLDVAASASGRTLRELGFTQAELDGRGALVYASGRAAAAAFTGEGAAALLSGELRPALRLPAGSAFRVLAEEEAGAGRRTFRLRQVHEGVEVSGAEVIVEADESGAVLAVLGRPQPELPAGLALRPALAGDAALGRALGELGLREGGVLVHERPAPRIYAPRDGAPRLAYRAVVEYQGPEGLGLDEIYASAADGALLARHSRVYRALNRSVYDLRSACLQTGDELPGAPLFNEGGTSGDATARAAYDNAGTTYWFYRHFFGRDSYDDRGATLSSSVHAKFFDGSSCTPDNAAWIGAPYNQMAYGDGSFLLLLNTTRGLDVAAHEMTHAVTNLTSDLVYQDEPGALNEALSDILGAGAEAWKASGGGQAGNPAAIRVTADTWKIGERVAGILYALLGGALRFMDNPTRDGYSKDYYPERLTGAFDNGGVHGNSGIANLAFYLLSQGGAHPRGKTMARVSGIGVEKALRIFYRADTLLFTSTTNFQGARAATAQAAIDLYGSCSAEWRSVQTAWDAVGVPGSWTPC